MIRYWLYYFTYCICIVAFYNAYPNYHLCIKLVNKKIVFTALMISFIGILIDYYSLLSIFEIISLPILFSIVHIDFNTYEIPDSTSLFFLGISLLQKSEAFK